LSRYKFVDDDDDGSVNCFFLFTAWAILILYGEEATRQALKRRRGAAAAYEQERHCFRKIPEPAAAQPEEATPYTKAKEGRPDGVNGRATETKRKRKTAGKTAGGS
jgi:hypothetical protein